MESKALNRKLTAKRKLSYVETLRVPKNTQLSIYSNTNLWVLRVVGRLGVLTYKIKKSEIVLARWGLNSLTILGSKRAVRTQLRNLGYLLLGVDRAFSASLEIKGVGFKIFGLSPCLRFDVGQTHPIFVCCRSILKSLAYKKNTRLLIRSVDFKYLHWLTSYIRELSPPVPYTGKGLRYAGETIKIKPGKKK